jgi:antitoxin VapB
VTVLIVRRRADNGDFGGDLLAPPAGIALSSRFSGLRLAVSRGTYQPTMTAAKVFMNGRSQAIRLPKEFRVATDEVFLKKTPEGFVVVERDPWEVCIEACQELPSDFMAERVQPAQQHRKWHRDR